MSVLLRSHLLLSLGVGGNPGSKCLQTLCSRCMQPVGPSANIKSGSYITSQTHKGDARIRAAVVLDYLVADLSSTQSRSDNADLAVAALPVSRS